MKILTVIIISIAAIYITSLPFIKKASALDIATQEQCEAIGGTWNTCPPNECQKSEGYKKGEIICPQVCGQPPLCEGITPQGKEDLSEIQNPSLFDENKQTQNDIDESKENTATPSSGAPESEYDAVATQGENVVNINLFSSKNRSILIALIATAVGLIIYFWLQKIGKQK